MAYVLRGLVKSRKTVTFSGNLQKEDIEVHMTHTKNGHIHLVVTELTKYQQTKRNGKFQFKSSGGGTGQC